MAAAKPTEQLHAELECPVCQDWYTDPVDLSCGHNFCRPCLLAAFRARPDDSGEFHDFLDCPVCRKRTYTNTQKIGKMPVNLKLRNIITAIQAKENVKPTECEVHHKPHVMFCHDCKDVKCLTCFTKACKLHNTEEIDDIGSQLRSVLNTKRAEIDQRIENLNKLKEKVKYSTVQDAVENELVFLLEQVESLNVDLIDEKCLVSVFMICILHFNSVFDIKKYVGNLLPAYSTTCTSSFLDKRSMYTIQYITKWLILDWSLRCKQVPSYSFLGV